MVRGVVLRGIVAFVLWLLFGAYVIGCGTDEDQAQSPWLVRPLRVPHDMGPAPSSPAKTLRALEWAFNNKALEGYRRLLAADVRFFCSAIDSAGNPWRGTPWTREDELLFATHFFVGGGSVPPATTVRMSLDRNFFVFADPSYPWDPDGRWHTNVRTTLTLLATQDGGSSIVVQGHANFFLVRGDSALIPEDLRLRGTGPDSTTWYLRRWDDETDQGGAPTLRAQPSSSYTVCRLKSLYR